jgi:hypothetical protein
MSWWKIFIYFLFLLVLLVGYRYQQIKTKHLQEAKEKAKRICSLKLADIKKYSLKNEHGYFQFEKQEQKWRLVKPINDWANQSAIQELLEMVIKAKAAEKITPLPKDLSPYGFSQPKIEVSLFSKQRKWALKLGDNTPNGDYVYALTTDKDAIYLLPNFFNWRLNKTSDELVDKHILNFDPVKIVRLSIKDKNLNVLLEKEKNDWLIKEPFSAKADREEVEDLLYRLQTAKFKTFSQKKIKPTLEISLWEDINKKPFWLKLAKGEEIVGQSNYHLTSFILHKGLWEHLSKDPEFFKDRHFIDLSIEGVSKVEINYKEKIIFAKKQGKDWKLEPKDLAEPYEIEFFLDDLANLKYLPQKNIPKGLASPQANVKLYNKDDQLILELNYYKVKEQSVVRYKDRFYPVADNVWESFPLKIDKG